MTSAPKFKVGDKVKRDDEWNFHGTVVSISPESEEGFAHKYLVRDEDHKQKWMDETHLVRESRRATLILDKILLKNINESEPLPIGDGWYVMRTGMDTNGNYCAWVSRGNNAARKIQTNGNAPTAHHKTPDEIVKSDKAMSELRNYANKYFDTDESKKNEDVKTFDVIRNKDVSGISGTGKVAEVAEFSNGKAVISWVKELPGGGQVPSVTVYDSIEDVTKIHGHDGATKLQQNEDANPDVEAKKKDLEDWTAKAKAELDKNKEETPKTNNEELDVLGMKPFDQLTKSNNEPNDKEGEEMDKPGMNKKDPEQIGEEAIAAYDIVPGDKKNWSVRKDGEEVHTCDDEEDAKAHVRKLQGFKESRAAKLLKKFESRVTTATAVSGGKQVKVNLNNNNVGTFNFESEYNASKYAEIANMKFESGWTMPDVLNMLKDKAENFKITWPKNETALGSETIPMLKSMDINVLKMTRSNGQLHYLVPDGEEAKKLVSFLNRVQQTLNKYTNISTKMDGMAIDVVVDESTLDDYWSGSISQSVKNKADLEKQLKDVQDKIKHFSTSAVTDQFAIMMDLHKRESELKKQLGMNEDMIGNNHDDLVVVYKAVGEPNWHIQYNPMGTHSSETANRTADALIKQYGQSNVKIMNRYDAEHFIKTHEDYQDNVKKFPKGTKVKFNSHCSNSELIGKEGTVEMVMAGQPDKTQIAVRLPSRNGVFTHADSLDIVEAFGDEQQLKVAKDSMKMSCAGCRIMGGPNHKEAAKIIKKLTGKDVKVDADCDCNECLESYQSDLEDEIKKAEDDIARFSNVAQTDKFGIMMDKQKKLATLKAKLVDMGHDKAKPMLGKNESKFLKIEDTPYQVLKESTMQEGVADEIRRQLSTGVLMGVGARNFVATQKGLKFNVGRGDKNILCIDLNGNDEYDIKLYKFPNTEPVKTSNDIGVENLNSTVRSMGDF